METKGQDTRGGRMKLPRNNGDKEQLIAFASEIEKLQAMIGFPLSARGWGYTLEGEGLITKAEINNVEKLINVCRKLGYLPVDFTAGDESRLFKCVHTPNPLTPQEWIEKQLDEVMTCEEKYYLQMVVEKIDLRNLFGDICHDYHVPVANAKGWSSIRQRATYARRFKEAEERGLQCVLLYFGDHDPDGLRISDKLQKNLVDVSKIVWGDGEEGYNPENLIIDRFGLNFETIEEYGLVWIENLITGSGRNLADPSHCNFMLPYVQQYLKVIGERKCEANAVVKRRDVGMQLCEDAIQRYYGIGGKQRFYKKWQKIAGEMDTIRRKMEYAKSVGKMKEKLK